MADKITSISQLKKYAQGQIVEFPEFGEGQPFIARIRRPSMLALAKTGKIPNSLLKSANTLFAGKGFDTKDDGALTDLFSILDVICEDCFIEPSYNELKEAGIELTDEQLMFIFNYTQTGVKALSSFRFKPEYNKPADNVKEVSKNSV